MATRTRSRSKRTSRTARSRNQNRASSVSATSIHVVYNGKTEDIDFGTLFPKERLTAIGLSEGAEPSAKQVKTALAQHYDVGIGEFDDHYVEVNPNGNITVRPNTTFG